MRYLNKILKLIEHQVIKTRYSHFNLIYKRKNKFIFSVDCSGLLKFWLSKRYPLALAELIEFIRTEKGVENHKRLFSMDFYDLFLAISKGYSSKYWKTKSIHQKLENGDILAFINPQKKGRFGHVAIVDKEICRTDEYIKVRIIDSSNVKHDNQWRQSDKMGVGCGMIKIYPNSNSATMMSYHDDVLLKRELEVGQLVDFKR